MLPSLTALSISAPKRPVEIEDAEPEKKAPRVYSEYKVMDAKSLNDLLPLANSIETAREGAWLFSSEFKIRGVLLQEPYRSMMQVVADEFVNDEQSMTSEGCGSYNCFFPNVQVAGDERWQGMLLNLLRLVKPTTGTVDWDTLQVSVRAPSTDAADGSTEETLVRYRRLTDSRIDELLLTLFMAHVGISLPVLAAIPVSLIGEDGTADHNSYIYFTPAGWEDLKEILRNVTDAEARAQIASELVALLNLVASYGILLTDVKLTNIVGRKSPDTDRYELKMIDFDAYYTTDMNLHEIEDGPTSKDCAFFVNGLLLLNTVHSRNMPDISKRLVDEVVKKWREMSQTGFCAYIGREAIFPERDLQLGNMVRITKDQFPVVVRDTIFSMLDQYGDPGIILKEDTNVLSETQSYITLMVDRYELLYSTS